MQQHAFWELADLHAAHAMAAPPALYQAGLRLAGKKWGLKGPQVSSKLPLCLVTAASASFLASAFSLSCQVAGPWKASAVDLMGQESSERMRTGAPAAAVAAKGAGPPAARPAPANGGGVHERDGSTSAPDAAELARFRGRRCGG